MSGRRALCSSAAILPSSEEDLAANIRDRVLFHYDKADPRPDAMAILDRQAAWLGHYPQNHALIAGKADERGTEEYNLVLGQQRADAQLGKGTPPTASLRLATPRAGFS